MSSLNDDSRNSLVRVATAVRPRGLKGEIVAELLTDFPDRFEDVEQLIAVSPKGEQKSMDLEDFWFQNKRIILKFADYNTVEAAAELTGFDFCVPDEERVKLDANQYFDFELEGCEVQLKDGRRIGPVESILKTGGAEILMIKTAGENEVMVPLAESIVTEIDTVNKRIVIDPPEGLLELS